MQSKYDTVAPGYGLFISGILANHVPSQYTDSSFALVDRPNCIFDAPISAINLVVPAGYRFCTLVKLVLRTVKEFAENGPPAL